MAWLKSAAPLDLPPSIPGGPVPPKAPGMKPPFPPKSTPLSDEKKDVLDGKGIAKALKALIQKEKSEPEAEGKDVKLLEKALESVEKFLGGEEKEVKEKSEKKEPKEEKPKEEEKE